MSEVVERVARAIYRAVAEADDWSDHANDLELMVDMHWEKCVPQARAAIAAMREPTKAMIEVMMCFDLERACHAADNCTHHLWENEAPILWQAVIDEALR